MMQLSIVIVSWNTRTLLAQCLRSLRDQGLDCDTELGGMGHQQISFEVLVVDNSSTDGTPQWVKEQFPWVQLIENRENVGFARANNQALRVCSGQYLLLLNPDTKLQPRALETLVSFMDEHSEAGAAGAMLLNPDGTLQSSCYPAPTLSRELWRLFHLDAVRPYAIYCMTNWDSQLPKPVDVVLGACLILRREALDQVGLLDEDYFIYSEEVDLCYRLCLRGWRLYWVPQATVVHYGGQSTRQVARAMFLHLYRSKVLFFRKHRGQTAAWVYKLILSLATLSRLAATPAAWLEPSRERREHLTLFGHYWQLLRALPRL